MNLGLSDKIALVAAASKGLGRAVAEELAAEGASLVLCARGEEPLREAVESIAAATGREVHGVVADVSTMSGIERVVAEAHSAFGRVDVLVTNSGGPPSGPFEEHDWGAWQRGVDLLLRSSIELTRHLLPGMKQRRWGRILAVTSIAVKQPVEGLVLSNALRAGVTGAMRTLANEVAPFGITVNTLLPGYTRTARVEQLDRARAEREGVGADEIRRRVESQIPMRRLGEPREFAALAAFLASERASYITGQAVAVDGGWIKGLL
jgi:3-oxoacyl-[acyl-carrier protein] reductase